MLVRCLAVAALALVASGCDDARRPADDRATASGEAPPPAAPETTGTTRSPGEQPVEAPAAGEVVIQHQDDAPPAPLALPGTAGSCDVREVEPLCFTFTGAGWTTAAAQAECAGAEGGVFQSAACPAEGRIGECVYRPDGEAAREIVYAFYTPMDPLIAEGVCRGTFRAL